MSAEPVESQSPLGTFLKVLRGRIPAEASTLGPHRRLPLRCGRRVTQEEIAEVVGVSRGWYRMLETGARVRPSVQLLDRLALALVLTPDERTTLFALAVPEMWHTQMRADSSAILEAFSWVRATTKRLWTATSETEAYLDVCERIAERFDDATLVHWMRRDVTGMWERNCFTNRGSKRVREIGQELNASLRTDELDTLMLYPQLYEPGAVGTTEHLSPKTQRARLDAYSRHGLVAPDFIHARIRSRAGLIGGVSVMHERGRVYSPTECAVLGALAELTSLALS